MTSLETAPASPHATTKLRRGAPPGERHPNAKMTEVKVRELRQWYGEGGVGLLTLASAYGIAYSTCKDIVQRRTWKHVADLPTKACPHCCGSGRVPM